MKKILSVILVVAMMLSLVACGKSADSGKKDNAGSSEFKVAMISDSSINDGGWGTACYNAMVDACEANGWTYEVTDSISQDAYYDSMVSYCSLGYNLIYAPGNQYTDAVLQAAKDYPDVYFALLNGNEKTPGEAENGNVASLLPDATQIGWIAGALAGLMTETGTIAFIGGMELDTTLGKYAGFGEAAKFVGEKEGKTITVLDPAYAGSFDDSNKGIELAKAFLDQNADVFFGDASAVDSGARQAIDEKNGDDVKVYDIAQPADFLGQNPCIIGSQVTDNSSLIGLVMKAIMDGKFEATTYFGTLENGCLSAGKMSDLVPKDVQDKYLEYIQQMTDGTFMK